MCFMIKWLMKKTKHTLCFSIPVNWLNQLPTEKLLPALQYELYWYAGLLQLLENNGNDLTCVYVVTHLALCSISTPFPEINLSWIFFPLAAFSHMLVLLPLSSSWYNPPMEKTGQVQWSCYSGKAPSHQGESQPQQCPSEGASTTGNTDLYMWGGKQHCCMYVSELEGRLQPPPLTHGSFMFEENHLSQDLLQKLFRYAFLTHFFYKLSFIEQNFSISFCYNILSSIIVNMSLYVL